MLTPRQWALYRYLKERGDVWTTQYEIARTLTEYGYTGASSDFHDSRCRLQMTADIRAIKESKVIQKVVISSSKGVKIANKSELKTYIGQEINAAVRRIERAKLMAEKGRRDGQMRMVLGKERDTIEAFLKEVE